MVSIIIPTYNEADNIGKLISHLAGIIQNKTAEIIVSDGTSMDATLAISKRAGAIAVLSPRKGRAAQMNHGASIAKGDIFYFVHADTIPPLSFFDDITSAVNEGFGLGRYRTKIDSKKAALRFNAFFTRFDMFMCYGGDQTLFITKDLFNSIGGFNESMFIMEDYEIVTRARKVAKYKIIQKAALISARKYDTNGWFAVQKANYTIVQMYKKGATQQDMVDRYKKMLSYR